MAAIRVGDCIFSGIGPVKLHAVLKQTFRYPDWIARFRSGNFPQFIARLDDGRLVRVSLALIPQAGWTLIRVVPPGTVDQIDMELDQRNRQDIE